MNTKLLLMSLLIAVSIVAVAALPSIITSAQIAYADNDKKDSPSDNDNGGGNDPPNNKNHRGNN